MTDFNPGPGWHEVHPGTPDQYRNDRALVEYAADGKRMHVWVREEPVPPLPTEPYTVIRVTWKAQNDTNHRVLTYIEGNEYEWVGSNDQWHASNLPDMITDFEVLSEPRAVTAKAVLDRVRAEYNDDDATLRVIAREFGVES